MILKSVKVREFVVTESGMKSNFDKSIKQFMQKHLKIYPAEKLSV